MEYKSEILKISYIMLKAAIKEIELQQLDKLINKRAAEDRELVTYAFMGDNALGYAEAF